MTAFNCQGGIPTAVWSEEILPLGVKTRGGFRTGKIREMVAPFAVFRLVINDTILHFHFTNGVITLEVVGVIHGVPQAEFNRREKGEVSLYLALVGEDHLPDFDVLTKRNEVLGIALDTGTR